MGKYVSARTYPRWLALAPSMLCFVASQPGIWGFEDRLPGAVNWTLSLMAFGFPSTLLFAIAPLAPEPPQLFAAVTALNLAFWIAVVRVTPARVSSQRLAGTLIVWVALTGCTRLALPQLMKWTWGV